MGKEASDVLAELKKLGSPAKAKFLRRFFRTGKGEYGEGDVFLGVTVPQTRSVAKKFSGIGLNAIEELLESKEHEARLCALLILVQKFRKGDEAGRKKIFDFYMAHAQAANSWDLVDLSADKIAGEYLAEHRSEMGVLEKFAVSRNLWERRIAMVAAFAFIKRGEHKTAFRVAGILLHDEHDLIHKAAGWMLREAGKRGGLMELESFLEKHAEEMPRTMLRYAIERMPKAKRRKYLGN